jgi:hypothetical protein
MGESPGWRGGAGAGGNKYPQVHWISRESYCATSLTFERGLSVTGRISFTKLLRRIVFLGIIAYSMDFT